MGTRNKLNIYLVKQEFADFAEIVEPNLDEYVIDGVGTFYTTDSFPHRPAWLHDFFQNALPNDIDVLSSAARGLLLVRVAKDDNDRIFAIGFGFGRNLLKDGVVEERFGLRVVLNNVVPDSLRSIDKTTLGSVTKQSREQISLEGEASSFGIDIEQDLVSAVTGRSKNTTLGRTISGRDSFAVSVEIDVTDIIPFLLVLWREYEKLDYKTDFEWIDQIREIRDPSRLEELDGWLVDQLNHWELEKIWMAPPVVLDWVDVEGFRYGMRKRAELKNDLKAREFLQSLGEDTIVDLSLLKKKQVFLISSRTDDVSDQWSAYRCLYAEASVGGAMFVLNNAKWYQVADGFADQVFLDYQHTPLSPIELPNYDHDDEGVYNESVPGVLPDSWSMDRKVIPYGGEHSTVEFFDVMTGSCELVHVKRYGGSSEFSHLFNQGVVAAELFVQEEGFRRKLNAKLPTGRKLADVVARPNPGEFEIIFAIISGSQNPLEIPFFSKVTLRNARRRLLGYGYKVSLKKIQNLQTS